MRIAITGASGFIARHLIPALQADGHALLLVGRDAAKLQALYPAMAVADYQAVNFSGYDAVIHTAVLNNDEKADAAQFRAVNVTLLQTIAQQAQAAGVPLFINLTTLHALEPPFRSAYAQSKHDGEQALAAIDGMQVVQLRLAAVHAGTFRGNLAMIDGWPPVLQRQALLLLSALRPTAPIARVIAAVKAELQQPGGDRIVSEGQTANLYFQWLKRLMDIGFALSVIVLLWWLLIGVAIAIRRQSTGPALFRQTRIGKGGRPFTCYKFRTMHTGVREAGTHEIGADAVTPLGAWLRRTRIDELPQAINILFNQMSLVGPRPCLPVQQVLIERRQALGVFAVKPGISGLAQVRGVDMSDPETLARLDAQYIARQSLLLDLKIIFATLRGSGKNDYVSQAG